MSRIEELEQQLNVELARQEWEGYAKTSEELLREYLKKFETVFPIRRSNIPIIMAALRMHLKVLEGLSPLAAIIAETMANTIEYEAVVAEVPE